VSVWRSSEGECFVVVMVRFGRAGCGGVLVFYLRLASLYAFVVGLDIEMESLKKKINVKVVGLVSRPAYLSWTKMCPRPAHIVWLGRFLC
jgi:hypothetical protein